MKVKTDIHAGKCTPAFTYRHVTEASGGGYYGKLVGDEDGVSRFFNQSYTSFCPRDKGVVVGDKVVFAPITEAGSRYGKVAYIIGSPCLEKG